MSETKTLIKKSKVLTEIAKAIFGADVKYVFAPICWYMEREPKAEIMEQLRFLVKNLEDSNKGFQRHKDNTGVSLYIGSNTIIIEYKDGRLVRLMGSDWGSAELVARTELEEI